MRIGTRTARPPRRAEKGHSLQGPPEPPVELRSVSAAHSCARTVLEDQQVCSDHGYSGCIGAGCRTKNSRYSLGPCELSIFDLGGGDELRRQPSAGGVGLDRWWGLAICRRDHAHRCGDDTGARTAQDEARTAGAARPIQRGTRLIRQSGCADATHRDASKPIPEAHRTVSSCGRDDLRLTPQYSRINSLRRWPK